MIALLALTLHVLGVIVWVGGLIYQTHVLLPRARRGDARAFAEAARRGRPAAWAAVVVVVLTGFYNLTRLGPLTSVMERGVGLMLAGKFFLVIAAVTMAGQRDFAQLPRLRYALDSGGDPTDMLRAIMWLDRLVVLLAIVIVYMGLALSRL